MFSPDIILTKERINEMTTHLTSYNLAWFNKHGIETHLKNNFWLLAKRPGFEINSWNQLTNGLMLDRMGTIWSMPVTHINLYSSDEGVDKYDIVEKMDGVMFCCGFPSRTIDRPYWHTRRDCTESNRDGGEKRLLTLVSPYFKNISFAKIDETNCYTFVLVHDRTEVPYASNRMGVYLVAARAMQNLYEFSEDELDSMAAQLHVQRPLRWHPTGWETITKIVTEHKDIEGIVLRHNVFGDRIQIKRCENQQNHLRRQREAEFVILREAWFNNVNPLECHVDTMRELQSIDNMLKAKSLVVISSIKQWKDTLRGVSKSKVIDKINKNVPDSWIRRLVILHFTDSDQLLETNVRTSLIKMTNGKLRRLVGLKEYYYDY